MMLTITVALAVAAIAIIASMSIVMKDQRDELEYLYEVIRHKVIK